MQHYKTLDLSAAPGIALCEVPLKKGRGDYLLLANRKACGLVQAKKEGTTLAAAAEQA